MPWGSCNWNESTVPRIRPRPLQSSAAAGSRLETAIQAPHHCRYRSQDSQKNWHVHWIKRNDVTCVCTLKPFAYMRWSTLIRPKMASLVLVSSLEMPSASTLSVRRAIKLSSSFGLSAIRTVHRSCHGNACDSK